MTIAVSGTATALRPLDVAHVRIDDPFWTPRVREVREVTLPYQLEQFREVGHYEALSLDWRRQTRPHIFWDSDVAKWIEAASYLLAAGPDAWLEEKTDELIALLAAAQQEDGYLNTYFLNVDPSGRFTDLRDAHELYCAGHLIEAGVAHFAATGKRSLLDVVIRYADLIGRVFGRGPGQIRGYDGHPEIELALVRLAAATGEQRFLDLARYFVDERGTDPGFFEREAAQRGTPGWFSQQFQDREDRVDQFREHQQVHKPLRDQREAVGHAVRATYLYSGATDLAHLDGDDALHEAVGALWDNVTGTRSYITGGIGTWDYNEGFTRDYDLPTFSSYAETCASIAMVFWAERMARYERDAKYLDVLERTLYNGVLSGVSEDGTRFFYDNPLASQGDRHRSPWFGVACCPPNLARLIASLGSYVYSADEETLVVNLYVGSEARLTLGGADVTVAQHGDAPWGGSQVLRVGIADGRARFSVRLRVPGWAEGARVRVAGEEASPADPDGFVTLFREWVDGDVIEVDLPVEARRVWADPRVESTTGRVAIARGPIVYCAEAVDNGAGLDFVVLPRTADLVAESAEDLPGAGVMALRADALREAPAGLYRTTAADAEPTEVRLVPYYAWDNRAPGEMRVWLREI
jgi:DUF1680 family protein